MIIKYIIYMGIYRQKAEGKTMWLLRRPCLCPGKISLEVVLHSSSQTSCNSSHRRLWGVLHSVSRQGALAFWPLYSLTFPSSLQSHLTLIYWFVPSSDTWTQQGPSCGCGSILSPVPEPLADSGSALHSSGGLLDVLMALPEQEWLPALCI